jgi:hypothetical protein
MTTTIKGDLILTKDTVFDESIVVKGSILGEVGMRYDLKVKGDIDCHNIVCDDINAGNIDAWNIDAWNINAGNINASFIICESITQKEGSKLIARHVLTKRSTYERKEQKVIE